MADAPKKKSGGGKGIKKKYGPLPLWGWGAVGAGTFLAYRYLKARSSANAALASLGTTGGNLLPNSVGSGGLGTGIASAASGAGSFVTQAAWEQAMLTYLTATLSPSDALSAVTNWLNGNCVSAAAYNAIASAVESTTVGLPPGYTSIPTLSVCPAAQQSPSTSNPTPTPPPATPAPISLPHIDAQTWPIIVKYLQDPNAATDFTQIGVVNNGVYQGKNVSGGAPVYAGLFGGYAQDYNQSTLPNGTKIYVPTSLLAYVGL